jgi:hypothetical protein
MRSTYLHYFQIAECVGGESSCCGGEARNPECGMCGKML